MPSHLREKIVSLSPGDQQAQQNAADAHKVADGLRAQAPAANPPAACPALGG